MKAGDVDRAEREQVQDVDEAEPRESVGANSFAGGSVDTSSPGELLIHRVTPE